MKPRYTTLWTLTLVLALVQTFPAAGGKVEEGESRALRELSEELTKLENLDDALTKKGWSERTLKQMRVVNQKLVAIARELEGLFHDSGEKAGEQAAKEFFSECTGLGTRLDAALKDKSKLPEVHTAVVDVVKKGREMAVFEPND